MRLDKFVSQCTALSRTHAKKVITSGGVSLAGATVKDPSVKVSSAAVVVCGGRILSLPGPRYLMFNKPSGAVCTSIEDDARSVFSWLGIENVSGLHIAGRLDIDTTGLVLMTDDGAWSHLLTSPKKQCGKRYRVKLADALPEDAAEQFEVGIQLKGERQLTRSAQLSILSSRDVLLTIHEGKYHQVKRMFAALGNRVVGLHREQVGPIRLDTALAPGEWRWLSEQEISSVGSI